MLTKNGTKLEADEFVKGNTVFIATEEEKVALPVGEYEMENGTFLSVVEEGVIDNIGDVSARNSEGEDPQAGDEDLEHEEGHETLTTEHLMAFKEEILQAIKDILKPGEEEGEKEGEAEGKKEDKKEENLS